MKKSALVIFLFYLGLANIAASNLDSVLNSLANLTDSAKIDSLTRLSRLSSINNKGEEGFVYANWALSEAKKNGFKDLIPKARFYLAAAYNDLVLPDSSAINYGRAIKEMQGTNVEFWDIFAYKNAISTYRNRGFYEKALNEGYRGLKYFEEKKDSSSIAKIYSEIGYVNDRMQSFEEAIKWQKKALKIFKELNDERNKFYVIARIGVAYDDLQRFDSAHFYNEKALQYHILNKNWYEIGQISSNIGNTYIKQQKWIKALGYLEQAYTTNKSYGDNGSLSISAINLGNVYTHLGDFVKAKEMLKVGIESSKKWGW